MNPATRFPLLLAAAAILSSAQTTESGAVFRSDVSLVRVDAQVLDRQHRIVTGLQAGDFVLREEGRPQEIRNFSTEQMPVDVLLLLDVSVSMRPHIQRIASASHQALRMLGENDRVAIMVFDRATRIRLPFRPGRGGEVERELERLLDREGFDGGTDITRGLLDAAQYVGRNARSGARRAIAIVTDDQTERNRDEEAVDRALMRAEAVLFALIAPDAMGWRSGGGGYPGGGGDVGLGGPLGGIILGRRGGRFPSGSRTRSAGTPEIARASGGDSVPVDHASSFEDTLERIRQRYALHFYTPPDVRPGQERRVEVDLAQAARQRYPGAEVRYRRTYYTPEGAVAGAPAPTPGAVSADSETVVVRASGPAAAESAPAGDAAPRMKRRPARDSGSPSREGPLLRETETGGWRRADTAGSTPAAAGEKPLVCGGGWRRVDEPNPCPEPEPQQPAAE
ncbi:MAG: VWA domain-containing protein, partial [Bryobacterales bacterium]|nr:VWA domain-containing protein [Bryobacterales bacterium]